MKRDPWKWAGDSAGEEHDFLQRELHVNRGSCRVVRVCMHGQARMYKSNALGYKNMNPECSVKVLGSQVLSLAQGGPLSDGGFLLLLRRIADTLCKQTYLKTLLHGRQF